MTLKLPPLDDAGARIRAVYALCLLIGSINHLTTFLSCGFSCDFAGVPIFARGFWTTLTFLDPAAAVLLFVRPRIGVALTLLIMLTDVGNNTAIWIMSRQGAIPGIGLDRVALDPIAYGLQIAFLIFVLLTLTRAWKHPRATSP